MKIIYFINLLFAIFILIFSLQSCYNSVSSSIECPKKSSAVLTEDRVEELNLTSTVTSRYGQSSTLKPVGYKFEGKEGQLINYSLKGQDICVWLYTSDNQIITSKVLPKKDKYLLQIAQSKGVGTFEIEMSLATTSSNLTKDEAENIIEQWLEAKKSIFGSSYNKSAGERITTDLAYQRQIQSTPGDEESVLEYLSHNGIYYTYQNQRVDEISQIRKIAEDRIRVMATITEQRTVHNTRKDEKITSASYKANNCYEFKNIDGQWKISKTPELIKDCGLVKTPER
jgi:ARC6-like, IMS domain